MKIITTPRVPSRKTPSSGEKPVKRRLGSLTKLITIFFVLGVVTGSIVDPSVYSGLTSPGPAIIPTEPPQLLPAFLTAILTLMPFEIGMLILALFVGGWLGVPLLTAFRGFELGILMRHILASTALSTSLHYIILAILPGAVFSSVVMILLAVDSVKLSGNLFVCVTSHSIILDMPALTRGYILKFFGYAILLACSGVIDLLACKLFLALKF